MTAADTFTQLAIVAIIFAILIILQQMYPIHDKGEWEATFSGDRMRRKINGKWQYRPMTDEEYRADMDSKIF